MILSLAKANRVITHSNFGFMWFIDVLNFNALFGWKGKEGEWRGVE